MRNPDRTLQRRLAGVAFEAVAPPRPDELPRMDVALFAGFAARGPVGVPVAVEDAQQFGDVFGGDAPLAWDEELGATAVAQLAPAVRLFFANGGRRCWVIRLARAARASSVAVPGVARIDASSLAAPLVLAAASPGRWADALAVASSVTSARASFVGWVEGGADLLLPGGTDLVQGDLLRFAWPEAGCARYAAVDAIAGAGIAEGANRRRVRVRFAQGVEQLQEALWPATLDGTARWHGGSASVRLHPGEGSPALAGPVVTLTLAVPPHLAPATGSVLVLDFGGAPMLFAVAQVRGSDADATVLQGPGRWRVPAGDAPAATPSVERLRLSLWVRDGQAASLRVDELGLGPSHARHPLRLPSDEQVHRAGAADALQAWSDVLRPRLPAAGAMPLRREDGVLVEDAGLCLPFAVETLPGAALLATHEDAAALVRDGLRDFDAGLFADEALFASAASTLVADAEDLRMRSLEPREPAGLHAALGIEEVSLLAVPDAVQPGWVQEAASTLAPAEPSPAGARDPREDDFLDCGSEPGPAPALVGTSRGGHAVALRWTVAAGVTAPFLVEEARQRDWSDATTAWQGEESELLLDGRADGDAWFRVRSLGGAGTPWSNGIALRIGAGDEAWRMRRGDEYTDATLLAVHRLLLRCVLARGDALAILSLPRHYREDRALAHAGRVAAGEIPGPDALVDALGGMERSAFAHAALYHGWLVARDAGGVLRSSSPDGAVAGWVARRASERGAWIAPANEALRGVLALDHAAPPARWLDLLQAQVNVLRQDARGFLVMSADTLADDEELRPVNVRRLLHLLRRAALRQGARWVFDPNDDSLRRGVERSFEALLGDLFRRGAFAGATARESFQVVTDASLNTRASRDAGRFIVELRVAPSRPMSFLTIRLTQTGDGLVASGR